MVKARHFRNLIRWPLTLLALIWAVFLVDHYLLGRSLTFWYGLSTREMAGLPGIVVAPLLHSGWPHLLSNSFPFLTLMGLLVFFYPRLWPRSLATLWLGTGALVWAFGRSVTHIGASGVVYALAAFLAFSGIFRRDLRAIVVSLVVLFYYGGMVVGILPGQEGISWESHLLGLIMGVLAAYIYRGELEEHEVEKRARDHRRRKPRDKKLILDEEIFKKTKRERKAEAFWEKLRQASEEPRK